MFPISDSIKTNKFPLFNIIIIAITVFVFIQQIFSPDPDGFVKQYALIPSLVNFNDIRTLLPFVTAIFLHGGWLHILSNMWFLWVFGDDVEGALGDVKFLLLYFVAGIIGNVVQYVLMPTSTIPLLGASGAIAGILGAYFIMFPYSKIKTLVFFFFFITIINISAPIMLGYWFILQLLSGIGDLAVTTQQGGVAFWAHVGGFVTGIIAAKITGGKRAMEGKYGRVRKNVFNFWRIICNLGSIFIFSSKIPFVGKLPGDIFIKKGNFTFYSPIATSIIISIILTLIFNFFGRK